MNLELTGLEAESNARRSYSEDEDEIKESPWRAKDVQHPVNGRNQKTSPLYSYGDEEAKTKEYPPPSKWVSRMYIFFDGPYFPLPPFTRKKQTKKRTPNHPPMPHPHLNSPKTIPQSTLPISKLLPTKLLPPSTTPIQPPKKHQSM